MNITWTALQSNLKGRVSTGEKILAGRIQSCLNMDEKSLQLLETGEITPDIGVLISITNFLQMDLCYFFLPDAGPKHFDLHSFEDDSL